MWRTRALQRLLDVRVFRSQAFNKSLRGTSGEQTIKFLMYLRGLSQHLKLVPGNPSVANSGLQRLLGVRVSSQSGFQ